MTFTAARNTHSRQSTFARLLVGAIFIIGLQGCNWFDSDDDPAPVPVLDQDASGLYTSGTGTLGGTGVSDIVAFIHDGRFMAFSVSTNILIDGTIDSIVKNDYTATVNVYKDGVIDQTGVEVTGLVTSASQMSGTLNGTGVGSGDFSLTFDPLYTRGATNERINALWPDTDWTGSVMMDIVDMEVGNFEVASDNIYGSALFKVSPLTQCSHEGTLSMPVATINIYTLEETMVRANAECTISETPIYTGFAAVVDTVNTDDTLLYGVVNGTNSVFAILSR